MGCCKAQEFGNWCKDAELVYTDEHDSNYCVFHAPEGKKGKSVDQFNRIIFERINQSKATGKECRLSGTVFMDDISFSLYNKDNPLPEIDLEKTFFPKKVSFYMTHFSNYALFREAEFKGEADFRGAMFKGERVSFEKATFNKLVQFNCAEFYQINDGDPTTCFNAAVFHGDAEFRGTEFNSYVTFQAAIFKQTADFHETKFQDRADFLNVEIEKMLRMEKVDLSKLSFLDTDLRKVNFLDCTFPKEKSKIPINSRGDILFDEEQLNDLSKEKYNSRAEKVEILYRQMKQKAMDEHKMQDCSHWHYNEKEIMWRRTRFFHSPFNWKKPFSQPFNWLVLLLYRVSSGFGEEPLLAGLFLLLLYVGAGALLGLTGMEVNTASGQTKEIDLFTAHLGDNSLRGITELYVSTFEHLTFVKVPQLLPSTMLARFIGALFKVLVPIQAALFGFALRNRFRR